ncbi:MAG: hypothetical protein K2X91_07980, partial [Thermoleophilia bacterium]|nr:hypothetical protein [Thermoleophilia bacterium]
RPAGLGRLALKRLPLLPLAIAAALLPGCEREVRKKPYDRMVDSIRGARVVRGFAPEELPPAPTRPEADDLDR